jgi:transcriptional regulator with XRE-family HTH domain
MDSVQFLDAVRARHGIPSDNKLAQFLGMTQGRVATYRTGRRKLDQDACVKIAKALELPPEHVFAAVQAERAKRTEHRRIWERLAKLAKTAHVLAVVGLVGVAVSDVGHSASSAEFNNKLYIMRSRLRRALALWSGARLVPLPLF